MKRLDIQALRGIAVLAVVLYHLTERFFPYGWLGVDFFFVISGYVLADQLLQIFQSNNTRHEPILKLLQFYRKRFWRLAPVFLLVLLGSTLLFFLFAPPSSHTDFSLQGLAALFLVANIGAIRFNGDYFQAAPNPLLHTWSLSVEEQIYIFLPLVLILMLIFLKSSEKNFSFLIIALTVCSFIINMTPEVIHPLYRIIISETDLGAFSFYSPVERFWQFGIGILTKLVRDRNIKINFEIRMVSLLTVFFLIVSIFYSNSLIISLEIVASIAAALIMYTKILSGIPQKFSSTFVWVGDRSYSIYLVHLPFIYFARYSWIFYDNIFNRRLSLIIAVILTFIVASWLYSKVEQKNRVSSESPSKSSNFQKFKVYIIYFCTLIALLVMFFGSNMRYFGLDKNPEKPIAEWDLTHECNSSSFRDELCVSRIEEGAKTVMLIGDSHAAHLKVSFLESARLNNFNAVVSSGLGCRFYQDKEYEKVLNTCAFKNKRIFEYIKKNKIDYVFVSQKVLANSPLDLLKKAILDLKPYVSSIIIIPNTPEFPNNYLDRPIIAQLLEPIWGLQDDFHVSQMPDANKSASNKLIKMLGTEVQVLDLTTLFCKRQLCSRFRNEKYLFIDESHLSIEGAKLVLPVIGSYMAKLNYK